MSWARKCNYIVMDVTRKKNASHSYHTGYTGTPTHATLSQLFETIYLNRLSCSQSTENDIIIAHLWIVTSDFESRANEKPKRTKPAATATANTSQTTSNGKSNILMHDRCVSVCRMRVCGFALVFAVRIANAKFITMYYYDVKRMCLLDNRLTLTESAQTTQNYHSSYRFSVFLLWTIFACTPDTQITN